MGDNRNHARLTEKEEKWLNARAAGMTPVEAAKAAGYASPYSAAFKLSRNTSLIAMNQAVMAAHGVDLPAFVDVLKRAMSAKKLVVAKFRGELGDEKWVEDHDIQLRAVEIGIELAGIKPAEEHKFVANEDDDTSKGGFLMPGNFHKMTHEELLDKMQMRAMALVTGLPMPKDVTDTDEGDIDAEEEFDEYPPSPED